MAKYMNNELNDRLIRAVMEEDLPSIKQLLAQSADVEYVNKNQNTPLLVAVNNDIISAAEVLLQHGADPNSKKGHNLPLQLAIEVAVDMSLGYDDVESDSTEMVELLLAYGADILQVDPNDGKNAYEFAKDYHTPAQRLFEQRLGMPPAL